MIYAGPNGGGKSSLRDKMAYPLEIEIDPDRIARQINPKNPRAADVAAAREALRLFDRALQESRSVSFETTLAGRTVLRRIQTAKSAGYKILLSYVVLDDVEENVRRVEQRAAAGQHWIEPSVIRRRAIYSFINLPTALALADRAVILNNSGRLHRQLLKIENGRIIFKALDAPQWLYELLPRILDALASSEQ